MKSIISFLFCLTLTVGLFAQSDIPKTQPLKIGPEKKLDVKASPQGSALSIPASMDIANNPNINDPLSERTVKMLPEKELKQAGFDMVIDPKVSEREKGGGNTHFGDMYLGDVKTGSNFIGVVCRDHEYVDGDRVQIAVNDHVVEPNILLTGSFKGVNINLEKGFNRLDFTALNQGSSGPNTAQVDVYDEDGKMIYSKRWLLSTGSKASLIIVKDD
ncbi:MAG: hypothetical protein HKN89_07495 [Eudoraea sp.]|nr:hypothetical protein [Eudoraea sp.]